MPSDNPQLDTTIQIVTPENIAFRYRLAGPFHRLLAYLIDLFIRLFFCIAAAIVLPLVFGVAGIPRPGFGGTLLVWFILAWFYGGLFETFWNGQTPGKRLCQLRVLTVDGQPINGLQAVLRNVLRAIDMQPLIFYQVGLLAATMNDRFQRLGDIACGTMVVVEERPWFAGVLRVTEAEALRLAAQVPAGFQASRSLARALAVYVQRRPHFPLMRRLEIARYLGEPLRERFGLAPNTDVDMLLCAVYHRTFITDRNGAEAEPAGGGSPFQQMPGQLESPFQEPREPQLLDEVAR